MTTMRALAVAALMLIQGAAECGTPDAPVIRVGIGMTVDELRAGSTYRFKDGERGSPFRNNWVIAEPYDLVFTYNGHELKKERLGGDNYLIAITTAPMSQTVVHFIQITFQNRALTLDEALTEAESLQTWLIGAGFRAPSPTAPDAKFFSDPFTVTQLPDTAPKYERKDEGYSHARTAFLDAKARIVSIHAFDLVTDDARAAINIANARRHREGSSAQMNEMNVATEREYFLNFSVVARPLKRYWDGAAKPRRDR